MAGGRVHAQALILVTLMVLSGGLSTLILQPPTSALDEEETVLFVGEGDQMDLTLSRTPNNNFKLDLPNNEPLVSAEMVFTPKILPTQSGFVWDDANDWNHADAIQNGSSVSNGALTGSSAGVLWDFNTNNQGWTFSNSYTARVIPLLRVQRLDGWFASNLCRLNFRDLTGCQPCRRSQHSFPRLGA